MEFPYLQEWHEPLHRPEYDREHPERLFDYAKEMQQWYRRRVSSQQYAGAIDHLATTLEKHILDAFDTMPEVVVTSPDVYHTRPVGDGDPLTYRIASEPLPKAGDAQLYGEHSFTGKLYGFHRGVANDIRAYVECEEKAQRLMGGIYTPLLSVGIEHAHIQLAEYSATQRIALLQEYITSQHTQLGPRTVEYIEKVLTIGASDGNNTAKLHDVSPLLVEIRRHKEVTPPLLDALTEIIKLRLRLDVPHDMVASMYHEQHNQLQYIARRGPETFARITPNLEVMGDFQYGCLYLSFLEGDTAIRIPAQYVTRMTRSE